MSELIFLLPITILAVIGAIFGFWLKWSIDRDERKEREQSTTNHQPQTDYRAVTPRLRASEATAAINSDDLPIISAAV